jgi:hypothetical protein
MRNTTQQHYTAIHGRGTRVGDRGRVHETTDVHSAKLAATVADPNWLDNVAELGVDVAAHYARGASKTLGELLLDASPRGFADVVAVLE